MTYLRKRSRYFVVLLIVAVFSSCTARIDGVLREEGSADLTLRTNLEPAAYAMIRSLMGFMGEGGTAAVLDGAAISRSLAASPGIGSVSLRNTSPSALEGSITLTDVGNFLSQKDGSSRFITYTSGRTAGSSSIVIALDRNSAPEIIPMLSPDAEDYLSMLMAPAVLGEAVGKQEYLNLLASVYGRALSNEVAAARIRLAIECPRPVTAVKGGASSGRMAQFDIPLADILVLETPLNYEIHW